MPSSSNFTTLFYKMQISTMKYINFGEYSFISVKIIISWISKINFLLLRHNDFKKKPCFEKKRQF